MGGVVFGVIVGVLIMLLLNRKRPRRRSRKIYEKSPMSHFKDDEVAVDGTGTHSGPAFAKWQIHLPQPVDDQSIGQQFKTLLHQIELHVENFYTGSGVSNLPDASRTAIDSYDSGLLPSSLSTLLTTDHDVRPFIKHSLTYSVTRQIDVKAPVRSKLLPREVTTLPFLLSHQSRDGRHTDRKGPFRRVVHLVHVTDHRAAVLNEAYSMWRVLTAYLRPQDENNAQSPSSAKAVTEIAQHFSRTFAPWADSRKLVQAEDIRATNLIDILDFAVEVGMLLFSQPSQMEMKWVSADRKRPTAAITTAPALYKTTDQQGKALVQPQLLVESTMM